VPSMPVPPESRPTYRFGGFELDPRSAELRKDGLTVRLGDQPLQILLLLLRRPGEVVSRDELRQALWPADTFVDFDAGLNSAIKRLRDALGDSAESPRFVETLPRRGYRFLAAVEAEPSPGAPAAPPGPVEATRSPRRWMSPRAAAVLIVVLIAVAAAATRGRWHRRRPPAPIRSIAVLPFENLGGDPEQEYFVDGMTDAVTTDLAQVSALRVISRTSVAQYKKTHKPLRQIAAELDVDAVVEGAVIRSGNRVRVTAQLIAGDTDEHLWARDYDREVRDVLTLQAEVAAAIAEAVEAKLQPREQRRLSAAAPIDPDVYEAYLKGRFYWASRTAEGKVKAEHFFQEAIAKDPKYAPAWSGLSDTYRQFGIRGLPPREYMPRAEAAARQALLLDDTLAEAHASLAGVLYRYEWDWEGAEREFRLSLELDPSSAEAHRAYAIYLMALRRNPEALVEVQRAWELSPLSPVINVELGLALTRNRRYADAVARLERTEDFDASFWRVFATLAMTYEAQGDWARAVPLLEKANALGNPDAMPWLGYAYGVAGRRREALALVSQMEALSRTQYVSPQNVAFVYLGLGDKDRALAGLEKAYEERAFEVLAFAGDIFDRLHDDPRFQDLLRRMRMPLAR
jgi:TolB-like protein/DNA-binding winged helix-turn-helix (wHTH) protein/Tfp pilus assembly protein PilF